MITLTSWAELSELLDLMHELMTLDETLDDERAFAAACAEMPALLDLTPDARYAPARVVLFDEQGRPAARVFS